MGSLNANSCSEKDAAGFRHPLYLTNLCHFTVICFQMDEERTTEENAGIATIGKKKRARRCDGRGRERGRGTQVNEKTLITGTKQSTGTAEATAQTQSSLEMTLCISRQSQAPPPRSPPILSPTLPPTPSPTFTPPSTPV